MNIRLAAAMNGAPKEVSKPGNDNAGPPQPQHDGGVGTDGTDEGPEEQWFVGSVDQGTTSSRFLIFDNRGEIAAGHQMEFENLYPESG